MSERHSRNEMYGYPSSEGDFFILAQEMTLGPAIRFIECGIRFTCSVNLCFSFSELMLMDHGPWSLQRARPWPPVEGNAKKEEPLTPRINQATMGRMDCTSQNRSLFA